MPPKPDTKGATGYHLNPKRVSFLTILAVALTGAVVLLVQAVGVIDFEAVGESVAQIGNRGLLAFGFLYVVLSLVGISKTIMTILAGTLFSFPEALLVTVTASTLAALIGFYVARNFEHIFHKKFTPARANQDKSKFQIALERVEAGAKDKGFYTVAILRLSLVPLMILSYASGLVRTLGVKEFFWAVFLTNIYMNFIYILVGDSLTRSLPMFLIALTVLILSMQAPRLFTWALERFNSKSNRPKSR